MFINSSDIIKSKTPQAAIEIDEDSRAYDLTNTQPNTQGKHEDQIKRIVNVCVEVRKI